MTIKVLSVFGTRPEAIKLAPVVRELAKYPEEIISRVCITAQHREMLDQVLDLFEISPDYDLNLMKPNQSLEALTSRILLELTPILQKEKPDWLLVQGDTTTVMAASIAAFYQGVKVGHVEAGLRTGDKKHPFPEEINRRIAGVVADFHFAPTQWARENLLREGIPSEQVLETGNTVIDALQWVVQLSPPAAMRELLAQIAGKRLVLVTAHRRENFGKPIEQICLALRDIAKGNAKDVHLIYPVHLNPRVQEPVYRILKDVPNITLLPPLDYLSLVHLMKNAYLVLTDSGGIQEEAPGLGKPVLVLREKTERPEGVEAGTVRLVGTDKDKIIANTRELLDHSQAYRQMAQAVNPYGDGKASERIVKGILNHGIQ